LKLYRTVIDFQITDFTLRNADFSIQITISGIQFAVTGLATGDSTPCITLLILCTAAFELPCVP
jgi:hypothetical protein